MQETFDGIDQDLVPQPDDKEKADLNKNYFDKQNSNDQEQAGILKTGLKILSSLITTKIYNCSISFFLFISENVNVDQNQNSLKCEFKSENDGLQAICHYIFAQKQNYVMK